MQTMKAERQKRGMAAARLGRSWGAFAMLLAAAACQIDDRVLRPVDPSDSGTAVSGHDGGSTFEAGADATLGDDGPLGSDGFTADDGPNVADATMGPDAAPEASTSDGGPTNLAIGQPCGGSGQCASAKCVDGFCCNTACTSACSACNVGGHEGTCSPVPSLQAPAQGHPSCGPDAKSTCGKDGTCDGAGLCHNWGTTTVCAPSSCNSAANTTVGASKCDGSGNCVMPASISCGVYTCKSDNTACNLGCTVGGGQCSSGNVCTNGSCGLEAAGATCTTGSQCVSTHCVDGVCCDSACSGPCQACDLVASPGTCTAVPSGAPHGNRAACASDGSGCGGSCGGNPNACSYPASSVACRSQSCASGTLTLAASCDANGHCGAVTTQGCPVPAHGTATCSGTACGIACDAYHQVSGSACVAKWTAESVSGSPLRGIWGSSATDVYAIDSTHVYHSTGQGAWKTVFSPAISGFPFASIWGDVYHPNNVWTAGDFGYIFYTTDAGATWTQQNDPNGQSTGVGFNVVTGFSASNVSAYVYTLGDEWAVFNRAGWNALLLMPAPTAPILAAYIYNTPDFIAGDRDGNFYTWTGSTGVTKKISTSWPAGQSVFGMWGRLAGTGGVVAVGGGGTIFVDNGSTFAAQTSNTTNALLGVYGVETGGSTTYFAVGAAGTIVTSSGNGTWTAQASNTSADLASVWAASPTNVFAAANDGTVMHYNGP